MKHVSTSTFVINRGPFDFLGENRKVFWYIVFWSPRSTLVLFIRFLIDSEKKKILELLETV